MQPVELQTSRLFLRPHRPEDFADCLAMRSDPEIVRYIGNRPNTAEEVWARLLRYAGHWSWMGFGYWVVCEAATGRFVGEMGLADFRRGLGPDFDGRPEIGWVLARWAHGQGFATEAAGAALGWADAKWPADDTVCMVDTENTASLNVAAKCGYVENARATYKESPVVLLRRRPAQSSV